MRSLLTSLPKTRKEAMAAGSSFYFTGKPCLNGHVCRRYVTKGCYDCNKKYLQQKYRANPAAARAKAKAYYEKAPEVNRKSWLKRRYGITCNTYDEMLARQANKCAICGSLHDAETKRGRLHVDHCHGSGAVRGLLCQPCNTALGNLGDDKGRLLAAIDYLNRLPRDSSLATAMLSFGG